MPPSPLFPKEGGVFVLGIISLTARMKQTKDVMKTKVDVVSVVGHENGLFFHRRNATGLLDVFESCNWMGKIESCN